MSADKPLTRTQQKALLELDAHGSLFASAWRGGAPSTITRFRDGGLIESKKGMPSPRPGWNTETLHTITAAGRAEAERIRAKQK